MTIATHTERIVLIPLLSFILLLFSTCTERKIEEKQEQYVPSSKPQNQPEKPAAPIEDDSARKPTQDSVKKPVRMLLPDARRLRS